MTPSLRVVRPADSGLSSLELVGCYAVAVFLAGMVLVAAAVTVPLSAISYLATLARPE